MREILAENTHLGRGAFRTGLFSIVASLLLLGTLAPCPLLAQQVPPRAYQMQEHRMIAPTPPSNADRVRLDVINATNPRTGRVDVSRLVRPRGVWSDWQVERRGSAVGPRTSPGVWDDWATERRGGQTVPSPRPSLIWEDWEAAPRGTQGIQGAVPTTGPQPAATTTRNPRQILIDSRSGKMVPIRPKNSAQ
jgi:hypothetical protein